MRAERAAAAITVERLLRSTPRDQWPLLAAHPELTNFGALERLGNLFNDVQGRDPRYALDLTQLAVMVAEGVRENSYPRPIVPQLLAGAWRDLGRAYRDLARNNESVEAFQRADTYLHDEIALGHDRALVRFNLAITLQELERYSEALELLATSEAVFREHGDIKRLVRCGIFRGVLLQRLKRFREARETYLLLLSSARNVDLESLAALHQAIGFCSIDLGDYVTAEANLDKALSINRELGKPIEVMKVELGRGRLLTRTGRHQEAIDHLRPVRRQFLAAGISEEAGLCGLEVVEAMLALDKTTQAESLARRIIAEFTKAGLNKRAITALGYLTEAIASRSVPPDLVTHVREYIVSLRTAPERDFVYVAS
ncbi:MAG TPA: tetratricopeptide repeat protein [Thermoanaerobaculia bacterium]